MEQTKKKDRFQSFISGLERAGNKLPHPFILFLWLILVVIILSVITSMLGVHVTYEKAVSGGEMEQVTLYAKNFFSREIIRDLFMNFQHVYFNFSPLRAVFPLLMAIGIVEQTGLLNAFIRKTLMKVPKSFVVAVLIFVALNANLASDAGVLAATAIGGSVFHAMGMNPWIGIAAAFSAGNAGYAANMLIASQDLVVNGITTSVSQELGINAPTHVLMTWYFLIVMALVLPLVGSWVTNRFTVKHLQKSGLPLEVERGEALEDISPTEKKGLRWAGLGLLAWIVLILILSIPKNGLLRSDTGTILPKSPLMSSIIFILFMAFMIPGIIYGIVTKTIKKSGDVPTMMMEAAKQNISLLVLAMTASLFIHIFNLTNLPTIIGVSGGNLIQALNLDGVPSIFIIILLTAVINLFIASANAKWMILAPVYIPMFTVIGFSPAFITALYRIGDSITNPLTPLGYMLFIAVGLYQKFDMSEKEHDVGLGTVISYALPYSIFYFITFSVVILAFYFLNLPLGPGISPHLTP